MINFENIFNKNLYSHDRNFKNPFFLKNYIKINNHHYKNCKNFKKFINNFKIITSKKNKQIEDFPMLPVNIFKFHQLISVPRDKIVKEMNSSGTTSNNLSKIFLDKENSLNQKKTLCKIVENIIGKERLPMLIVEKKSIIHERKNFNAKVAAITGFSLFGKNYTYLIKEDNQIDYNELNKFLNQNKDKKFLIFGFTSQIYENLINKLSVRTIEGNFKKAILIHGGGWKKLEEKKINNSLFKKKIKEKLSKKNIFNYYGMIEQTGTIFFECKHGFFHTTIFSDIFIRDKNLNVLSHNKKGIIQLISLIPTSYPGHNILTEDIGLIAGEDNCKCGLKGKYFKVEGRIKQSEVRGCSDVR